LKKLRIEIVTKRVHASHMKSNSKREFVEQPDDQHERSLSVHDRSAMETLAQDPGADLALVIDLYERELAHLEATATVRGFLPVLASRNVRMALRARSQ
jgi:hypothetical protein